MKQKQLRRTLCAGHLLQPSRGKASSELRALFSRAEAIRKLLRDRADTINEIFDHPELTDDEKRIEMDRVGGEVEELGREVYKIKSIVLRSN
ncbi:MAG TPA: hypothetical protein VGH16_11390 [Candidatus Binatia bacterium]|jgi:hypothetical protein